MNSIRRNFFFYMLILIVLAYFFLNNVLNKPEPKKEIVFSEVVKLIEQDKVKVLVVENNKVSGELKDDSKFSVFIPNTFKEAYGKQLYELAEKKKITVLTKEPAKPSFWIEWIPILIMVGGLILIFVIMNKGAGGASKAMSFGKNRAKLYREDSKHIKFEDVAGLVEEKEEVSEIVDFLKEPKRFASMGARIPKGVLMVGLPGTGKTYLSRAIAGEAGVPFYSISGSDFVEMFVGVGASRVRDLFNTAKKTAPCIVFIDEIDAVGRRRGAGLGGGNDEREQTLNQLLVEMDGFGEHAGIIIIAATNRPDILDPALLRPGRFDRKIQIGVPDIEEREAILKVHARNKPINEDVDFKVLARRTPYFTPADLENILNESALLAARNHQKDIDMQTIESATTKVIAGVEKKSKVVIEKEKWLVSVHEAGHAILARVLPNSDPVHHITIIPRGQAGGFTMQLPEEEINYVTKNYMLDQIVILLGGRIAEKVFLGDISTGASNDLKRVTDIAKNMVVKYAMSDNLSQMAYSEDENVFIAKDMTVRRDHSEQVIAEIDREISKIVDSSYNKALELIKANKDKLENVAKALFEYESLNAEEFELVFTEGFEALKERKEQK